MYFAQALGAQTKDKDLSAFFAPIAQDLNQNESKIHQEFIDAQGVSVDLGGYYKFDDAKAQSVMCPSATFNAILAKIQA